MYAYVVGVWYVKFPEKELQNGELEMVQQMGTRKVRVKVVSEGYSIKYRKNSQENKTVKLHQYCFIISEAVIFLANLKL